MDQNKYVGFFIDWLIESFSMATVAAIFIGSTSIYVGIYLYINGMVADIKMRLKSIEDDVSIESDGKTLAVSEMWTIYEQEIKSQIEFIG